MLISALNRHASGLSSLYLLGWFQAEWVVGYHNQVSEEPPFIVAVPLSLLAFS